MTWEKFCILNKIPPRYQNARAEDFIIPDDKNNTFLKKAQILTETPRSAVLTGGVGRGKTFFLFALLHALFKAGKASIGNVRFYRSIDLDSLLVSGYEKYKSNEFLIQSLTELDYLFLDDFGIGRETSKAERDYYDIIDRRTSLNKITIISTNLDANSLKKLFGDRIFSRLRESVFIEFNGPDLRKAEKI